MEGKKVLWWMEVAAIEYVYTIDSARHITHLLNDAVSRSIKQFLALKLVVIPNIFRSVSCNFSTSNLISANLYQKSGLTIDFICTYWKIFFSLIFSKIHFFISQHGKVASLFWFGGQSRAEWDNLNIFQPLHIKFIFEKLWKLFMKLLHLLLPQQVHFHWVACRWKSQSCPLQKQ